MNITEQGGKCNEKFYVLFDEGQEIYAICTSREQSFYLILRENALGKPVIEEMTAEEIDEELKIDIKKDVKLNCILENAV